MECDKEDHKQIEQAFGDILEGLNAAEVYGINPYNGEEAIFIKLAARYMRKYERAAQERYEKNNERDQKPTGEQEVSK